MNLKIVTMFIQIRWNSRKEIKILIKTNFGSSNRKSWKKITWKLFDKRDALLFYFDCISYLDSNIPSKILYFLLESNTLPITRTTNLINWWVELMSTMIGSPVRKKCLKFRVSRLPLKCNSQVRCMIFLQVF